MSHALEDQVIVVQAADLIQSWRIIPDLATWSQCYALYVAVLATDQPERLLDLPLPHRESKPEVQVAVLGGL